MSKEDSVRSEAMMSIGCVVLAALLQVSRVSAQQVGPPARLRCEYQQNPGGLDVSKPRLSWWLTDARRGAKQTAYRVLVASSPEKLSTGTGDLWDSGKVESDKSTHVPYGGNALVSRQLCFWKVQIWDAAGKPSGWSQPASWEMALLNAGDWKSQWITVASKVGTKAFALSPWYWHPTLQGDNKNAFFVADVVVPANRKLERAEIALTADNAYDLYVNGNRVGSNGTWEDVERYAGGKAALRPGKNRLAVKVANADGPAGLTMGVELVWEDGKRDVVRPDNWLCSDKPARDWEKPAFVPPRCWVKAKGVGKFGAKPWGDLMQVRDAPRRSQMMRGEFTLPAKVAKARVYVTGLGMYELWMNGKRAGKDVFTPGWTQYEKRIQYQVYDVADLLKQGRNAVGALLGNGWWSSGLGWKGASRHAKPDENLRLLMQLEVTCDDGSKHIFTTGPGWRASDSPITEDTLYHGEAYDARLEQRGWNEPAFDDSAWPPVVVAEGQMEKLCAQRGPALRVTEELKAKKITEIKPGVYVLDFGQNHSGRPRLTVRAPAGTTIRMTHAEYLKDDSTLQQDNYRTARVTDSYTCKGGGVEVYEPTFTYRGFRYMQVTGLPAKPDAGTIVSRVLYTAPPWAGTFECSDPLMGRILENVRWGQVSNMHSVPTDCPQRDERLGWMGDAQAFAPMSIWNMDMALFYTKWMRDILQAQQPDGSVPGVCPTVGGWVVGPGRSAWADAITIIPWYVYLYYGDETILAENYEGNQRWVAFIRSKLNKDGLYEQSTWGDWVPVVKTPDKPIAAMYGHWSTKLLGAMAGILGKDAEAGQYAELAETQRTAFNRKHLNRETKSYFTGTQTANILPLAFGMVDGPNRQAVADNIAADVKKHGGHHTTGFLGTPFVLPILAEYGHAEAAYGILNTKEYPSLGYMIEKGATTIWERWNSDKMGPGMNSRNHFAFGSQAQWLYEGLAGLNPDPKQPGFKHVVIKPHVVGDLKWVRASYPCMYGRLSIEWRRGGGTLAVDLVVPPNTTATLHLPATGAGAVRESGKPANGADGVRVVKTEGGRVVCEIEAGTYVFTSGLH